MKQSTENIIDNNGIEITVTYEYEKSPPQIEHQGIDVGGRVYTNLKSVILKIGKQDIELLLGMEESTKDFIIGLLNYE